MQTMVATPALKLVEGYACGVYGCELARCHQSRLVEVSSMQHLVSAASIGRKVQAMFMVKLID